MGEEGIFYNNRWTKLILYRLAKRGRFIISEDHGDPQSKCLEVQRDFGLFFKTAFEKQVSMWVLL